MDHKFKAFYLFCGIGGGALGFQQAEEEYKGIHGSFETICGIDCDPECCQDFEYITGSRADLMDLFSREQYVSFHGEEPPEDWKEVTPEDIREACRGEYPDIVFTSPPCKGFSGLLPEKSAKSEKYQALNKLTIRGIKLICEAFEDDLPSLILLENVPRITTRGKELLSEIKRTLKLYGYVFDEGYHDCGEIGGLSQHRKRYLLICRNPRKIQSFVYKPPIQRVKTLGEAIEELPLPDDKCMGPMHKLPKLQWKTWVRLALIPSGGDWRDLQNINLNQYRIEHEPRNDSFGIMEWDKPCNTVTGNMRIGGSSKSAIPDPRLKPRESRYSTAYFVIRMDEPGPCVTGTRFGSGAPAVADIRTDFKKDTHHAIYRISKWDEASNTVTGAARPNNGAICVSDPRGPEWRNGWKCTGAVGKVNDWNQPTDTVLGHSSARGNGASNVSDPRFNCTQRAGTMGVMKMDESAKTVTSANIYSGTAAVADPRIPKETENGVWIIISTDGTWHRPLTTLELAVLQGLPTRIYGRPLELAGKSDSRWRERIGNMVPVGAGKAIGETMLRAMLPALKNEIVLGWTPIWVRPRVVVGC